MICVSARCTLSDVILNVSECTATTIIIYTCNDAICLFVGILCLQRFLTDLTSARCCVQRCRFAQTIIDTILLLTRNLIVIVTGIASILFEHLKKLVCFAQLSNQDRLTLRYRAVFGQELAVLSDRVDLMKSEVVLKCRK
jgi:hypothetical protein